MSRYFVEIWLWILSRWTLGEIETRRQMMLLSVLRENARGAGKRWGWSTVHSGVPARRNRRDAGTQLAEFEVWQSTVLRG